MLRVHHILAMLPRRSLNTTRHRRLGTDTARALSHSPQRPPMVHMASSRLHSSHRRLRVSTRHSRTGSTRPLTCSTIINLHHTRGTRQPTSTHSSPLTTSLRSPKDMLNLHTAPSPRTRHSNPLTSSSSHLVSPVVGQDIRANTDNGERVYEFT